MSFYLRKEWVDQVDGTEGVFIHYTCVPLGVQPDWKHNVQTRELLPERGYNRKLRAKVIRLPRALNGQENYYLHYYFDVRGPCRKESERFCEEIVSDDTFTFVDYDGNYTNICVYWSINGWGAPNYSSMFEEGTGLDHHLCSLHFYGRAHDGVYVYERFKWLQSLPRPYIYHGKVHGPRGARVDFCYHIMRRGAPLSDEYDFWDNNEGLNYWKELGR